MSCPFKALYDFVFVFLTALGLHFGMQASLVAEHSSTWILLPEPKVELRSSASGVKSVVTGPPGKYPHTMVFP